MVGSWKLTAKTLLSVLVANASRARAIAGIGVLLRDLPVQGTQVILRLHLGRWRCRNAVCERRIFTEPLSKVCAPYAQQTKRSGAIIAAVGRALGGRPGQRLMRRLGIQVSADTLIR
jgi:hypothetical protein